METTVSRPAVHSLEWPEVPQTSFKHEEVHEQVQSNARQRNSESRSKERVNWEEDIQATNQRAHLALVTVTIADKVVDSATPAEINARPDIQTLPQEPSSKTVEPQLVQHGWLRLGQRFKSTKLSWPNPQLSLGTQCRRLAGNDCWVAIGPARELFALIKKEIADLLDERIDELEIAEPLAGDIVMFNMYMIGKSAATAKPMILFTSQSQSRRRKAIKFVRESDILKNYPKIALAEAAMSPLTGGSRNIQLLAGQNIPYPNEETSATTIYKRARYFESTGAIAGTTVGALGLVALIILSFCFFFRRRKLARGKSYPSHFPTGDLEPHRTYVPAPHNQFGKLPDNPNTTGIFQSQQLLELGPVPPVYSQYGSYGAASPFQQPPNIHLPQLKISDDTAVSSNKPTEPLINVRSLIICPSTRRRATIGGIISLNGHRYGLTVAHLFDVGPLPISNALSTGPDAQDGDFEFAFDQEDGDDIDTISDLTIAITSQASNSSAASLSQTQTTNSTSSKVPKQTHLLGNSDLDIPIEQMANSEQPPLSPIPVTLPFASSIQDTKLGSDWALVEIRSLAPPIDMNRASLEQRITHPKRFVQALVNESGIIVGTSQGGFIRGKILSHATMMRLSQHSYFQEVWTIILDRVIAEGDSGSWVIDGITGDLYGHVVAGVPGGRIAYLVPASQVLKDIERVTGQKAKLDG
ncbi:uncharacterized protein K444DRAFT_622585 [Hyaloscypha bicolor E]|uniref:Uncharacterized protein n=1 Tax=Hyaloscypha bicolor E TaxID=1095630 RepID=A0A2J6SFI1_9HELO|nr:uncharacterized protein K444DRAFT_622585 [Hyaloscypha bicolor E]PMD49516.1 hypothetical protein K444DRAFT_622585 [Hyaloscypha bicolor E]